MATAPAPSAFVSTPQRIARERYQFPTDPPNEIVVKLQQIIDLLSSGSTNVINLTLEAGYPVAVDVPTGTDVPILPANPSRQLGSYIQNISPVDIYWNFGPVATPSQSGILPPGGSLPLFSEIGIIKDEVTMRQESGALQRVWVVSFSA